MRYFKDVADSEISNKKVIVRADLNVPMQGKVVTDTYRIRRSTKSILHLREKGAKTIVLAHIGRDPKESLEFVAEELRKYVPLSFVRDITGSDAHTAISAMRAGDVLLLENVRRIPGETDNDQTFVRSMAGYGEFYVNDAFSAAHRAHASIVGLAQALPHCGGYLLQEEVENLSLALSPRAPSLAILGGAKFETKEPLIKKLLDAYDHVFLAGALVNDALKAKGYEVGRSLISDGAPDAQVLSNPKLLLPVDVLVERSDGQARVRQVHEVTTDEKIVDIGPESFALLLPFIRDARTILWNGPTGWYEGGYDDWTHALAQAIAESKAQSVVGGGDTVAAIGKSGLDQQFTFLSTAGGAMLEFLLNGTLPGLQALE
ncbi:MAG: phosphoglycerate kinase [Candidatus Pacebacteria bacterium]|nr:phosphoglycerate kinase [Candidatus Paceibacterota bacterium]